MRQLTRFPSRPVHLFFLPLLLLTVAAGGQRPFNSVDQLGQWITFYYQHPEPEKVPAALCFYMDTLYQSKPVTRAPMIGFFSTIFKNDPAIMKKAFDDLATSGSLNARIFMINAANFTNTDEGRGLVKRAGKEWKEPKIQWVIGQLKPPPDLLTLPLTKKTYLDMLWAMFFATGDPAYVKKVISGLALLDGTGDEIAIGGAARWSLTSNALQHKKVHDICKMELAQSGGKNEHLAEAIREAEKGK
jgi:hypothetical protein